MNISKTDPSSHQSLVKEALSAVPSSILRLRIGDEGTAVHGIDQNFLLRGFLGTENQSVAVVGLVKQQGELALQNIRLSDEFIEALLRSKLSNFPGVKSVEYSEQVMDLGCCYAIRIWWDLGVRDGVLSVLGSAYTPRSWENSFATVSANMDYSLSELEKYIEKRRDIDAHALETHFLPHDLPHLLGFERERETRSAAVAAFGSNGGVQSALYVRGGIGCMVHKALGALTQGKDRDRYKSVKLIEEAPPPKDFAVCSAEGDAWHHYTKVIAKNGYSLGTGVFSIIENMSRYVCRTREIFGEDHTASDEFDEAKFTGVMRELLINAFCHGSWNVELRGRDDEWYEGNRVVLVHAGSRLEVINRSRDTGYLRVSHDTEVATRMSSLHAAFKDINLAKGRSMGQMLVRQRLVNLGMASPIFVRTEGYYRAIVPLENNFTTWGFIPNADNDQKLKVASMFVARLALSLTHLDEGIVSSVFYTRREHARQLLENLLAIGVLDRSIPSGTHAGLDIKVPVSTFSLVDPNKAKRFVTDIEAEMKTSTSVGYLSPGGMFQVSMRSMMSLVDKDKAAYVKAVYEGEILSKQKAEELTASHLKLLL